jgi:glycosyltransferase involved in cell wall biosynthesis
MASGAPPLKNIYLIADSYWPAIGGIEYWVHSIASDLSKQCRVTIITHSPKEPQSPFGFSFIFGRPFKPYTDDAKNQVIALKPAFPGYLCLPLLLMWNVPRLRRIVPKKLFDFLYRFYKCAFFKSLSEMLSGADLVHCFSTGYLGVCATDACAAKNIPLIHSPAVHFGKWGDSPLLLASYAKAKTIICLSNSFKTEFLKRMPHAPVPIEVIPVPMFESTQGNWSDFDVQDPFILFLGRREKHKGLFLLLSAFKKVKQNVYLIIAGPGALIRPGIPGVIDAGMVEEPVKNWLLENCEIFCLPSADESFGIVYLEAMMHGKPVVALDVAPINEIIINQETGMLVPPDREDLLAEAIAHLLRDPEKRRSMGENGRRRYRELYEGKKVMEKIKRLYGIFPSLS